MYKDMKVVEKSKLFHLNKKAWTKIFQKFNIENLNERIDVKDLKNPDSPIVKTILYAYTKETFLPYFLNVSNREHLQNSIPFLGPYACVLNLIL